MSRPYISCPISGSSTLSSTCSIDGSHGIRRQFQPDSVNADLGSLWLENSGVDFGDWGFDFGFTSIPKGVELEFLIDVTIYHRSGTSSTQMRWKVTKMSVGDCVGLKCEHSPGAVANWDNFQVEIRNVRRRSDTSKLPESNLIWQKRVQIQQQPVVDGIKTEVADEVEGDYSPSITPVMPVSSRAATPTTLTRKNRKKPETPATTVPAGNIPSASPILNATQRPKKGKFQLFNPREVRLSATKSQATAGENLTLSEQIQSQHTDDHDTEAPIETSSDNLQSAESPANATHPEDSNSQSSTETDLTESAQIQRDSNKFAKSQVPPNAVNKQKQSAPVKTKTVPTPTTTSCLNADVTATVPHGKQPLTNANSSATQQPKATKPQGPTTDVANKIQKSGDPENITGATESSNISNLSATVIGTAISPTPRANAQPTGFKKAKRIVVITTKKLPIGKLPPMPISTQPIVNASQSTANASPVAPEPISVQSTSSATNPQISSDLQPQSGAFIHDITGVITVLLKSNHDDAAIEQAYNFANVYNLPVVKNSCEEKLIGQISVGSLSNSVAMANSYGGDWLLAECVKFIRDNRGNPLLPWAQLMNLTDADGNFLLDIGPTGAEKTSLKRKRTEKESA